MKEKFLHNKTNEQFDLYKTTLFDPNSENWDNLKDQIIKLEEDVFKNKGYNEQRLRELFEEEKNIVLLLNNEENIFGYLTAVPMDEETVFITSVAIKTEFQGKGLVKKIMTALKDEAIN